MTPGSLDQAVARPHPAGCVHADTARRANARIRDMLTTARDEVRPLTPAERAEYERLREVYVRAVAAA